MINTDNGSVALAHDIDPGPEGSSPTSFRKAGNRIVFSASTTATGLDIWSIDPQTSRVDRWAKY